MQTVNLHAAHMFPQGTQYLNIIQVELFKFRVVVLKLLIACINIRVIWWFILVHLKVRVLGHA